MAWLKEDFGFIEQRVGVAVVSQSFGGIGGAAPGGIGRVVGLGVVVVGVHWAAILGAPSSAPGIRKAARGEATERPSQSAPACSPAKAIRHLIQGSTGAQRPSRRGRLVRGFPLPCSLWRTSICRRR